MSVQPLLDRVRLQRWRLVDSLQNAVLGRSHRQRVFERIHAGNLWGDAESASGSGSGAAATAPLRAELPRLFAELGIRSLLDAPCGDFHWMRDVVGGLDEYTGLDIVPTLIARNTALHGSSRVRFVCADLASDPLPRADAVLCRDCLIHLPTRVIIRSLRNVCASGARYVLLTNDTQAPVYRDVPTGSFRPIDLRRPPFGFPEPLRTIAEAGSSSRTLAVWEVRDVGDVVARLRARG